jgi:membrane associated rhomboid family serine protease
VGGALGFALLSRVVAPMVGASGALFGLIGALIAWDYADLRARGASPAPVVKAIAWLTVLNLALWWAMNGHLAWQTHLGGFVAGWLAARHFARQDR